MSAVSVASRGYRPSASALSVATRGYFGSTAVKKQERTGGSAPVKERKRSRELFLQAQREDKEIVDFIRAYMDMRSLKHH